MKRKKIGREEREGETGGSGEGLGREGEGGRGGMKDRESRIVLMLIWILKFS